MDASPPDGPGERQGAGEQDSRAVHVDRAQGTLAGDHGVQSNYFTEVAARGDAFVAGGDIYVYVDSGRRSGESSPVTAAETVRDIPSALPGGDEVPPKVRGRDDYIRRLSRGLLSDQHPDTLLARQLQLYAGGYQAWQDGDVRARRIAVAGLEAVLSAQREKRGVSHHETSETQALLAALRGEYSPAMTWPEDLPRPGTD